jgi:hypothetical protein
MPMIDVYARAGTFANRCELARNLAGAMMRWEGVPEISLFLDNTAAFVHDLDPDALANAAGDNNYVRVQILTPVGVLDRDKQLGVVKEMTEIVAAAAGDPGLWNARGFSSPRLPREVGASTDTPTLAPRSPRPPAES